MNGAIKLQGAVKSNPIISPKYLTIGTKLFLNQEGKLVIDSTDELCERCIRDERILDGCECSITTTGAPRARQNGFKAIVIAVFYSILAWVLFIAVLRMWLFR